MLCPFREAFWYMIMKSQVAFFDQGRTRIVDVAVFMKLVF